MAPSSRLGTEAGPPRPQRVPCPDAGIGSVLCTVPMTLGPAAVATARRNLVQRIDRLLNVVDRAHRAPGRREIFHVHHALDLMKAGRISRRGGGDSEGRACATGFRRRSSWTRREPDDHDGATPRATRRGFDERGVGGGRRVEASRGLLGPPRQTRLRGGKDP